MIIPPTSANMTDSQVLLESLRVNGTQSRTGGHLVDMLQICCGTPFACLGTLSRILTRGQWPCRASGQAVYRGCERLETA